MGTLVTDLTHFLPVPGYRGVVPPVELPRAAARLCGFLGSIVESMTAGLERGSAVHTTVACRKRPGRKPCPGQICGVLEPDEGVIVWACSDCGDNGYIHHYQDTPWDLTRSRHESSEVGALTRVTVSEDEYRCMRDTIGGRKGSSRSHDSALRLLKAGRRGLLSNDVILSAPRPEITQLHAAVSDSLEYARTAGVLFPLTAVLAKLGRAPAASWQAALDGSEFGLLASLDEEGYALDDGEARHAAHPEAFWIPDAGDRHTLTPGRLVKLIFAIHCPSSDDRGHDGSTSDELAFERMWVVVESRLGGMYVGRLDNQPLASETLTPGDPIFFGPEHVIDIAEETVERV